jgi:hypothetical protein
MSTRHKPTEKPQIIASAPIEQDTTPADPQAQNDDYQVNFDAKSSEAIDAFGQALATSGLNAAFCVIFDETDSYKPKVFYRGDMFEITRHTSRILNQMRFKLIGELNGNF